MTRIALMCFLLASAVLFTGCPQQMVQEIERLLPPPGYKPRYMSSAVPYDTLRARYAEAQRKGIVDTSAKFDQAAVNQSRMVDSVMRIVQSGQMPTLPAGMTMDSLMSLKSELMRRYPQMFKRSKSGESAKSLSESSFVEPVAPAVLQLRSLDDKKFPETITLRCTLSDSSGHAITGLAPPYLRDTAQLHKVWSSLRDSCQGLASAISNFSVRESRENSNEAHAIAFLVDHSGSMGKVRIRKLREAVRSTMNIMQKQDMVSVLPFAGSTGIDVQLSADSSYYKSTMDIEKHAQIVGGTAIYDGVVTATKELSKAPAGHRKTILLFTDGEDNSSSATLQRAVQVARDSGVAIYAVAYGLTNEAPLESLARLSGGRFYRIYSTREFPYMFSDIYRSLKSYYLITYQPPPCYGIHTVDFTVALPELGVACLSAQGRYDKSRFSELDSVGSVTLLNLEFETASAAISDSGMAKLRQIAADLKAHPTVVVEIRGHTDNVGSQNMNLELSQRRASGVADALSLMGVDRSRLKTKGFGGSVPLVPNDTRENRARNRRTEFLILAK